MQLLGTTVSRGMTGEGGLTPTTQAAVDAVTKTFSTLRDGDNSLGTITDGTVSSVREKYTGLSDDGPAQRTDEMLAKVRGYFQAAKDGDGNLPMTTEGIFGAIRNTFQLFKDGEGGGPALMTAALDATKTILGAGLTGEGGVQPTFGSMVADMVSKSATAFGAGGTIASKFAEAANAMATAAGNAATAALNAAHRSQVTPPPGENGTDGGHYAGLDDTGGSEEQPQWRKVHGKEAILESAFDAPVFRAMKQSGLWKALGGAIISGKGVANAARLVNSPASRKPAGTVSSGDPERSTMPVNTPGGTIINNRNSVVNVARVDARNAEDGRRFLRQVAITGAL
jgi:hypothetical protein